jgi:hypothetical protein
MLPHADTAMAAITAHYQSAIYNRRAAAVSAAAAGVGGLRRGARFKIFSVNPLYTLRKSDLWGYSALDTLDTARIAARSHLSSA